MRGALLSSVMLAAACYQPAIQSGVPCSRSGECPGGEACVEGVCGGTVTGPDAPDVPDAMPDAMIDAPPGSTLFVAGADKTQLRDTEVASFDPAVNFGSDNHFSVDDPEVGLLWFDLSDAPGGLTLVKATLRVVTTDEADEDGKTVLVYRMLESWTEAEATWTMRAGNTPWSSPGAAPPSRAATPIATLSPKQVRTPYQVELPVDVVSAWLADPAQNFGLAFVRGTSGQHIHFGSRETNAWTTLTLELRP